MRTPRRIAFGAMALLLWTSSALADEASKTAMIDEIFQVTKTDQMLKQVMEQMRSMVLDQIAQLNLSSEQKARIEEREKKLIQMVIDAMSYEKMKPQYVKLYQETFSEDELSGILNFYRTPVGRAMLDKMPALMSKAMSVGQSMMKDVLPEIERLAREAKQ